MNILSTLIMIGGGIFCIVCAQLEVPWFFNSYKAKPIIKLFGTQGAKTFYTVLGIILIVLSLAIIL